VSWIDLAQDRDQWRAGDNEIRFPKKDGDILE
jgi:hypothetical protein